MNQILKGLMIGEMLTRPAPDTSGLENQARAAQVVAEVAQERNDWRLYAGRLRANLEARKMSEQALLTALKEQNVNHPLATEAGFEAKFQAMLAEQYGENNASPESWDKFSDQEAARMRASADAASKEEGRKAVS